jgi:PAS domain S-box-containing protein
MRAWATGLQYAVTAGFAGLSLLTFRSWLRRRDRQHGLIALSVGLLGLVGILGRWQQLSGFRLRFVSDLLLTAFIAAGLAVLLLRDASLPMRPWVKRGAVVLAVFTTAFILWNRLPLVPGTTLTDIQTAAVAALVVVWTSFVAEPIVRFWRAGRGRVAVQRARLRGMSLAYGGVVIVLLLSGSLTSMAERPGFQVVIGALEILLVPIMLASLEPPGWLRALWRRREEGEMADAIGMLLLFADDVQTLASTAVEWPARLVGGDGALIVDDRAGLLATTGMDEAEARTIATAFSHEERSGIHPIPDGTGRRALVVPIQRSKGHTTLVVVSGVFTPPFGWEEMTILERFAVSLGVSMDRVELFQAVGAQSAQLERTAGQLREAQRLAQLGSWDWDPRTNQIAWSDELYAVYGVDPDEFEPTADGINELIHPDDREAVSVAVRGAMERHRPFTVEHRLSAQKDQGRVIQERGTMVLAEDGTVERVVGTGQDITEQKRAEDSLRAAYEREREAADRLRALDEMKSTFLTAVSHELRTPLTAVAGFAYTLEQRMDAFKPEERAEMLAVIARNATKLEHLLTDLLDLDRLQRGMIEPRTHPTDMASLVRRTVEESGLLDERKIVIEADDVHAMVDAAKVERIVENLLTNSVRHTPADSPIWVRVLRDGDSVIIAVEDAGQGVPEEVKASIFQPFEQGPDIDAHNPGVGIGLSLVAQFAKLHGGRAWVEDRPGGGASFRVLLPIEPPARTVTEQITTEG